MHFFKSILPLALVAAPVFAAPAPVVERVDDVKHSSSLETRAPMVTCRPSQNESNTKSFKVNTDHASQQASKAGLIKGDSGDPHRYYNSSHPKPVENNGNALRFGIPDCDSKNAELWEYPVFWETKGKTKEWEKDLKTNKQDKTPIRVVYVNKNGGSKYCGVMIHSKVTKEFQGKEGFELCT